MKKLILLILSPLLLTGCFGGGTEEPNQTTQQGTWLKQEFSTFHVEVPPMWRRVDKSKLSTSIPESTVAVYAADIQEGFIKNMNILKEQLNTQALPKEYARANITLAKRTLPQYSEVGALETDIHGQKTILHTFVAQNTVTDSTLFFTQSYFTKDNIGYTVTCVLPQTSLEEERALCDQAVKSFQLK